MSFWNNNDREESKPTYLNKIEKRLTVRTVRGWEKPLEGAYLGGTAFNASNYDPKIYTELLVAIPNDPSVTGVTSSAFTSRGSTAPNNGQGLTTGTDTPNYAPYFSCPFNGDSATSGGPNSTGVSHGNIINSGGIAYGVSKYGVSSLGMPRGVTGYIKVVANDSNFSNTLTIGLSGSLTGCTAWTKSDLWDTSKVPAAVFNSFFGPTQTDSGTYAYRTDNIAVVRFAAINPQGQTFGATGNQTISMTVFDGTVTASTQFTVTFNR